MTKDEYISNPSFEPLTKRQNRMHYRIAYIIGIIACLQLPHLEAQVVRREIPDSPENREKAEKNAVAARTEPPKLITLDDNLFSVNSGVYLLTPYKIVDTNRVEQADTKASFFIQFTLDLVTPWNPERRFDVLAGLSDKTSTRAYFDPRDLAFKAIDFQTSLSAFLDSDDGEATASTIVGSGDFAGEITLAVPILGAFVLRNESKPDPNTWDLSDAYEGVRQAHFLSAVGSYSAITDRDAFDVHHRMFAGAGYRGALKNNLDDNNREVLIDIRAGVAWIENADFISPETREVAITHGDLPDYDLRAGFGLESEVRFPISDLGYLTFGARLYGNRSPNPWSASMALTLPLDRLTKIATSK